ncbi:MAG: hypothetical protein ACI9V9_000223, partial [Oleispira sp.]
FMVRAFLLPINSSFNHRRFQGMDASHLYFIFVINDMQHPDECLPYLFLEHADQSQTFFRIE